MAFALVRSTSGETRQSDVFHVVTRVRCCPVVRGICVCARGRLAYWITRPACFRCLYDVSAAPRAPPSGCLRYPLFVPTTAQRSPTTGLLLGLIITLAAVVAYSFYITVQLAGLRKLQSEMVDRNRKDSLQLLRVQNDLNSIALAMRDMLDTTEPYPLTAWTAQFERIHQDLDTGLKLEENLAGANRTPEQRLFLSQAVAQFWDAVNRMFGLAQNGKDAQAREQIRLSLQAR